MGECLESVWSQSLSSDSFETIIIDDGSRDNTLGVIMEEIYGRDNVKFYSRNENKGQPFTRNQAIEKSSGEYLALLDADDILEQNALESTLLFMLNNPSLEYSYSRHIRINENKDFICDRPGYKFSREKLSHFNFVSPLKCFTRKIHEKIGGYDEKFPYAQDWNHVLKATRFLDDSQIAQNPEYLYQYRIHSGSVSIFRLEERKGLIEKFLSENLAKDGRDVKVSWRNLTEEGYNYFDWIETPLNFIGENNEE